MPREDLTEPIILAGEPYTLHDDVVQCGHADFDICAWCGGLNKAEAGRLRRYFTRLRTKVVCR